MIGNYPAIDDPEAQSTLDKVKELEPDCLTPKVDRPQKLSLAGLRVMQEEWNRFGEDRFLGEQHRCDLAVQSCIFCSLTIVLGLIGAQVAVSESGAQSELYSSIARPHDC